MLDAGFGRGDGAKQRVEELGQKGEANWGSVFV